MRMKRLSALLIALLLCAVAALAAAEDKDLFKVKQYYEMTDEEALNYEYEYVQTTASDGQSLYALTNGEDMQRLYRYQPGQEEPTLLWEAETVGGLSAMYESVNDRSDEQQRLAKEAVFALTSGEAVYALNYDTGKLGEITDSGIVWGELVLELPEMYTYERDYVDQREIYLTHVRDGKLSFAINNQNWDGIELYRIDLATGKQEKKSEIEGRASGVLAPYQDGYLMTVMNESSNEGAMDLYVLDAEGNLGEKLVEGITTGWNAPSGLCYDEGTSMLLYARENQMYRIPSGGSAEVFAYLPSGLYLDGRMPGYALGDTYALQTHDGVYLRSMDGDVSEMRPIRVSGGWITQTMQKYGEEHPQTPLLTVERYFDGSEQVANEIMSGDTGLDLFQVSVTYGGYGTLKNKGYMESLSGNAAIVGIVDQMYPEIARILKNDQGEVVALPMDLYTSSWSVNTALWEKEFPGQPLPETWAEWLTLYEEWENSHDAEEDPYLFFASFDPKLEILNAMIDQFLSISERDGTPIDFSAPVFREAMEIFERIPVERPDWANMSEAENERMNELANKPSLFMTYGSGMFVDPDQQSFQWSDEEEEILYLIETYKSPVFTAGQEPIVSYQMQVVFVNPNSQNKEAAMDLMAYMAENMENQTRYALMPDLNDPLPSMYYERQVKSAEKSLAEMREDLETAEPDQKGELEDAIQSQERYLEYLEAFGRYEISEKAIKNYREQVAPYLYLNENALFTGYDGENSPRQVIDEILYRYLDGDMALEEMIRELTQKARMIEQENR